MCDEIFDRHTSLGYQVNHAARLLARSLRIRIQPHGVVPGQFAQLLALYEEDGLTQHQLCERVGIDQSTMAHTVKRMSRDGLIRQTQDSTDRRRRVITLTTRARALQEPLTEAAQDVNALATTGLSDHSRQALMANLAGLIANLEADPAVGERGGR